MYIKVEDTLFLCKSMGREHLGYTSLLLNIFRLKFIVLDLA